jgi:hypothetical protein
MAKSTTTAERPKAVDCLVGIVEQAIAFRFTERTPTLSDLARVVNTASRLLRFADIDERITTENQVTLAVAKKLQLVS